MYPVNELAKFTHFRWLNQDSPARSCSVGRGSPSHRQNVKSPALASSSVVPPWCRIRRSSGGTSIRTGFRGLLAASTLHDRAPVLGRSAFLPLFKNFCRRSPFATVAPPAQHVQVVCKADGFQLLIRYELAVRADVITSSMHGKAGGVHQGASVLIPGAGRRKT